MYAYNEIILKNNYFRKFHTYILFFILCQLHTSCTPLKRHYFLVKLITWYQSDPNPNPQPPLPSNFQQLFCLKSLYHIPDCYAYFHSITCTYPLLCKHDYSRALIEVMMPFALHAFSYFMLSSNQGMMFPSSQFKLCLSYLVLSTFDTMTFISKF